MSSFASPAYSSSSSISSTPPAQDESGHLDLHDIHSLNLNYLLLAQRLIRENLPTGCYRTGMTEPVARILVDLSIDQINALARVPVLLCGFRLDDETLLRLASNASLQSAFIQARISLLLTQRATNPAQCNATALGVPA